MKYELSDIEKNNLMEFLKRVQLTGQEVPAFNDIFIALSQSVEEVKE